MERPCLLVVFCEGLCPALQVEMACRSTNITLSEYITTAIRLDNLIQKSCHRSQPHPESVVREFYSWPWEEDPEPMQLGGTRIPPKEQREAHSA